MRPRLRSVAGRRPRTDVLVIAVLLFAVTLCKGMAWTMIVPVGQQPDEPAHASYVDALANDTSLRQQPRIYNEGLDEALRASGAGRLQFHPEYTIPFDDRSLELRDQQIDGSKELRHETNQGNAPSLASTYPPLYYMIASTAVRATPDLRYDSTVYLERAISVVIASLTILVQFAVLLAIFASVARAASAAFVLTLMPMYTSLESAVNPDVLVVLFGSITLLLALRLLEQPYRWGLHVGAGVTIALGVLTKPNAIVFVVPYAIAAIIGAVRHRDDFTWGRVLRRAAAYLGPFLLIYGAWRMIPPVVGAKTATGGWPSLEISGAAVQALADRFVSQGKWRLSDMYWGSFGWVDTPMSSIALTIGFAVGSLVLAILLLEWIRGTVPAMIWICIGAVLGILLMVTFIEYLSVLGFLAGDDVMGGGFTQGRYFFPFVAAIVATQMWALDRAVISRWRLRAALWISAPAVVAAFHVVAVLGTVMPRYFL